MTFNNQLNLTKTSRSCGRAFLPPILLLLSNTGYSADWFLEPSVSFSAGYDDNPALVATTVAEPDEEQIEDISDQSFAVVGASFDLFTESERESIRLGLSTNFRRYEDSDLDADTIETSALYRRLYEKSSLDVNFGYVESSTLDSEFLDTGLIETNIKRKELSLGPSISSNLSDQVSLVTGLSFRKVTFDSADSDLAEFEEQGLSISVVNEFTERLDLELSTQILLYDPTDVVPEGGVLDEQSLALLFGLEYALQENFFLNLSVGPRFSTRDFNREEDRSEDSTSTLYDLGFRYSGFGFSTNGSISRTVEGSAQGGLAETDQISLGWSKPVSLGEGSINLTTIYSTRDDQDSIVTARDSYSLLLGYNKNLSRALNYSLEYTYRSLDSDELADTAESNAIVFQLQYSFDRKNLSN